MNKKILSLVSFIFLCSPLLAMGQTVEGILENVVSRVVWPVALAAVIIFWLATGILFLAALGDPSKLNLAKMSLLASIVGTVVIVLAASAITIIRNTLGI
jgi:type IV secretory pathway VirB2 component (pilin)